MWFLDQLKRAAQTVNQLGTGTVQDPTTTVEKVGQLGHYEVYTMKRPGDTYNLCSLRCVGPRAEYARWSNHIGFGEYVPNGVMLNKTDGYEPIPYSVGALYDPSNYGTIQDVVAEPAYNPAWPAGVVLKQVFTVQNFSERVCQNSEFGDKSQSVARWPTAPGKSCFGEYGPPTDVPITNNTTPFVTTGPTTFIPTTIDPNITGSTDPGFVGPSPSPTPSQIVGIALAIGLVVAVPVAAIAIGLIQCYRSLRGEAPSEANSEVTLEDALTFDDDDNDDTASVSSEAMLLEKD